MGVIDDIAGKLQELQIADPGAQATDWDLQGAFMSPDPDQVVVVKEGVPRTTSPRLTVRQPTVQIVVRGAPKDYTGARDKAEAVYQALNGWPGGMIGTGYYSLIEAQGDILPLGYDALYRPMFSINFQTMRSE